MPFSRFRLVYLYLTIGIFTLAFAILGAIFSYTYSNINQWREDTKLGGISRDIVMKYQFLQINIKEVESFQQAYLITSNPKYLVLMDQNIADVDSICQKIIPLIASEPSKQIIFDNLTRQINIWWALLRQNVNFFPENSIKSKSLKNRYIKQEYNQTEQLFKNIEQLKEVEWHKFSLFRKSLWQSSDLVAYWLPIAFISSSLLIMVAVGLIIHQMNMRQKALNQIKMHNVSLATNIKQQTQTLDNTIAELQENHAKLQESSLEQQILLTKLGQAQDDIDLAFAAAGVVTWAWDYGENKVEWGAGTNSFFENPQGQQVIFDSKTMEDFAKFVVEQDLDKIKNAVDFTMRTGQQHQVEYRLKGPNNHIHWVESRTIPEFDQEGKIYRMRGLMIERTASKTIERNLLQANTLFQAVFDSVADAFFLTDAKTGLIIKYNLKAMAMFNIPTEQELVGKTWLIFVNEENSIYSRINEVMEQVSEKGIFNRVLEFCTLTGDKFWGSAATTSTYQGRYLLTRISDISERIKFEQQLLHQQKKLEKALQTIEKDNQRKSEELSEARKMQISMMPSHPPQSDFLSAAMYTRPSTEVGGDYYDYCRHSDESITFVIGDATGHGLKASIVVATVKSYFQNLAMILPIGQLMSEISRGIQSLQIRAMYMGLQILHFSNDKLIYVSAGMPTFLIYRTKTKTVDQFIQIGLFLGYDDKQNYTQKETNFEKGDLLLAFTDGLEEYFDANREQFGIENIINLMQESGEQNETPQLLINRINVATQVWSKGIPNQDDITLLAIKAT